MRDTCFNCDCDLEKTPPVLYDVKNFAGDFYKLEKCNSCDMMLSYVRDDRVIEREPLDLRIFKGRKYKQPV